MDKPEIKGRSDTALFGDDDPSIASPAYTPFKEAGLLTMSYKIRTLLPPSPTRPLAACHA